VANLQGRGIAFVMGSTLALCALSALVTRGQNAPTIRTSASLVLVPVSPLDKSGQFVSGLSAADFRILVDGKLVEISNFDLITEGLPEAAPSVQTSAALPPNVFRNISESSASQPNVVIVLVDYLNMRVAERMALREELLKFFSAKLRPDQEIAVYGLTHSLAMLQPFTRDSSTLIAVATNLLQQKGQPPDPKSSTPLYKPGNTDVPPKDPDAAGEWFSMRNARREYNIDQIQRAANTLAAFRELAEAFGGMPGKKTVIWLTGDVSPLNPTLLYRNLPFDKAVETPETSWWQTAKTYEALNSAGISVFPVDVRGVVNTGMLADEKFHTHEDFRQSLGGTQWGDMSPYSSPTGFRQGEAANAALAMDTVASETGATVLAGSNDIGELLGKAHKLWANYYVLAFVPEKPANDSIPSYHKIKVDVDRRGVHVLSRRGYVTRPEKMIAAETEIERDLTEAAASPVDLTSVSLQLSLENMKEVDRVRRFPFSLTVSGSILGTVSDKGAPYDISIAVLVRGQDGKIASAVGKRVRDFIPQANVSDATARGLKYDAEFQARSGTTYFGRVIVRDNLSGRVGTISLALPNTLSGPGS
jgi:VWFA-related protein